MDVLFSQIELFKVLELGFADMQFLFILIFFCMSMCGMVCVLKLSMHTHGGQRMMLGILLYHSLPCSLEI